MTAALRIESRPLYSPTLERVTTRTYIWREREERTAWGTWRTPCVYEVVTWRPWIIELVDPLWFEDAEGRSHIVPAGARSDGASLRKVRILGIPVAERLLGSGSRPEYRRASFLHDYECRMKESPALAVHARYGPALAADRVSVPRALLMGTAVLLGGPRW